MASRPDRKQTHCRLQYLLDVPLSTYEWTFLDWQRWAPDCIPDSLKRPHDDGHLQGDSVSPCLQKNDESLWATNFGVDEGAESGASMLMDEEDAPVPASEKPQEKIQAPPRSVPTLSNNVRAQQWQRHPMFPEEGPLRNIADMLHRRPSFLFSKKLTSTDTNLSHCRLSVPKPAVRKNFTRPLFSQEEIDRFDSKEGLEVTAFDYNGEEYAMRFKLWNTCGTYILLGKWKELLQNNKLQGKAEAEVSVWAFRHPQTGRIVFLIAAR